MPERTGASEHVQPLALPLNEQQLAGPVIRDQEARLNEFFRHCLQKAREAGRDRAWVSRGEIVAEGEAMGLNEAQCLQMALPQLEQDWVVFTRSPAGRGFIGATFTDHPGLRKIYGG